MAKLENSKVNYKVIIVCLYCCLLFILYKLQIIPRDLQSLKAIVLNNPNSSITTFMVLSILRIFIFIPGAVFCILGGLIFTPLEALFFSFIGYLISFSLIFLIGRYLFGNKLINWILKKHPYIYELLKTHGTKLFTVGLLCPIAPGDLLCLLLSTMDISFLKYILITGLTHLPWVILYSLLGYSFHMSVLNLIMFISLTLVIIIYSITSWSKLKA